MHGLPTLRVRAEGARAGTHLRPVARRVHPALEHAVREGAGVAPAADAAPPVLGARGARVLVAARVAALGLLAGVGEGALRGGRRAGAVGPSQPPSQEEACRPAPVPRARAIAAGEGCNRIPDAPGSSRAGARAGSASPARGQASKHIDAPHAAAVATGATPGRARRASAAAIRRAADAESLHAAAAAGDARGPRARGRCGARLGPHLELEHAEVIGAEGRRVQVVDDLRAGGVGLLLRRCHRVARLAAWRGLRVARGAYRRADPRGQCGLWWFGPGDRVRSRPRPVVEICEIAARGPGPVLTARQASSSPAEQINDGMAARPCGPCGGAWRSGGDAAGTQHRARRSACRASSARCALSSARLPGSPGAAQGCNNQHERRRQPGSPAALSRREPPTHAALAWPLLLHAAAAAAAAAAPCSGAAVPPPPSRSAPPYSLSPLTTVVPRRRPVRRAAMRPTFWPGGADLRTVDAWPMCWWLPPPWGCSTGFMATPRTCGVGGGGWGAAARGGSAGRPARRGRPLPLLPPAVLPPRRPLRASWLHAAPRPARAAGQTAPGAPPGGGRPARLALLARCAPWASCSS
jgi:hypothetical protein